MLGQMKERELKALWDRVLGSQEPGQSSQAGGMSWTQRFLPREAERELLVPLRFCLSLLRCGDGEGGVLGGPHPRDVLDPNSDLGQVSFLFWLQ